MKTIKMFFLCAFICRLLSVGFCQAQPFQVIKATKQGWAGGVVGHHGINYHIELETTSHTICPDTIWINGKAYPADFSPKEGRFVRTMDTVTHKIKYIISIGEAYNDYYNRQHPGSSDTAIEKPKPARHFDGAALISYTVRHRQRFFIIKSFTQLQQLNYP